MQNTIGPKSRFLALILSLVPGGGYLYLELFKRGLQTLIIFFGSIFLGDMIGLSGLVAFVAPTIIFYTVFETQHFARRINSGEIVEDSYLIDVKGFNFQYKWLGYLLIIFGSLALLNNLAPYLVPLYRIKQALVPLAIIGLGVYIIYKNTNSQKEAE